MVYFWVYVLISYISPTLPLCQISCLLISVFTQSYGADTNEVALPSNPSKELPEIECPGYNLKLERMGCYKEDADNERTMPIQVFLSLNLLP